MTTTGQSGGEESNTYEEESKTEVPHHEIINPKATILRAITNSTPVKHEVVIQTFHRHELEKVIKGMYTITDSVMFLTGKEAIRLERDEANKEKQETDHKLECIIKIKKWPN